MSTKIGILIFDDAEELDVIVREHDAVIAGAAAEMLAARAQGEAESTGDVNARLFIHVRAPCDDAVVRSAGRLNAI